MRPAVDSQSARARGRRERVSRRPPRERACGLPVLRSPEHQPCLHHLWRLCLHRRLKVWSRTAALLSCRRKKRQSRTCSRGCSLLRNLRRVLPPSCNTFPALATSSQPNRRSFVHLEWRNTTSPSFASSGKSHAAWPEPECAAGRFSAIGRH